MSDFPLLNTGAVLQYPAVKEIAFSTSIVRYLDGSEQRFRMLAVPVHRWIIRLDLLDESELHRLRGFFRSQRGAAGTFTFTDPWDGTPYQNCRIESDELIETLVSESKGKTSLVVREIGT